MSINKVMLTGNLTRDPELRVTPGGTQVLNFGLAVNDRHRNAETGNWEDYANFIDCVMFGLRAEALSRILVRGMKVAVEGKLRYRAWDTKEGQRRSKLEVTVDELEFLSQRQDRSQAGQAPAGAAGSYGSQGGYTAAVPQGNYAQAGQGGYTQTPQSYRAPVPQGGYAQTGQGNYYPQAPQGGYSAPVSAPTPPYAAPAAPPAPAADIADSPQGTAVPASTAGEGVSAPVSAPAPAPAPIPVAVPESISVRESAGEVYDADIPF